MVDPYAIVKRLTGCDLISPKDGKQLIEAVDGLIDEIKGKDALIQSLSSQLAEIQPVINGLVKAIGDHVTVRGEYYDRAQKAKADRDRLAAENEWLRQLFDDYGDHYEGCDLAQPDCSCGMRQRFRTALASLEERG